MTETPFDETKFNEIHEVLLASGYRQTSNSYYRREAGEIEFVVGSPWWLVSGQPGLPKWTLQARRGFSKASEANCAGFTIAESDFDPVSFRTYEMWLMEAFDFLEAKLPKAALPTKTRVQRDSE